MNEWVGPFIVDMFCPEKKIVYVRDAKIGNARPFNIAQVKRYYEPEMLSRLFFLDLKDAFDSYRTRDDDDIFFTEIINANYPRSTSVEMTQAKKNEVQNILHRGTFKVIWKEDLPTNANVPMEGSSYLSKLQKTIK